MRLTADGQGVTLAYSKVWRVQGLGVALSEDLPLATQVFKPTALPHNHQRRAPGAVDDALPDEWGDKVIQAVVRPDRLSVLERLLYAGDHRFGALGVSTTTYRFTSAPTGPVPRLDQAQTLSDIAEKICAAIELTPEEKQFFGCTGAALGGATPKAVIEVDGQQWLTKFPMHDDFDSAVVEHATLTLAEKAGISTVKTKVLRLKDRHALLVRRFDRGHDGHRIDCISAGTAIRAAHVVAGTSAELGYPALAQALLRNGVTKHHQNQQDARELFRRMVFNILVGNTEDHEKTHSLLVEFENDHGYIRLAPAYGLLPTCSGVSSQSFACGQFGQEATVLNVMSDCTAFGLLEPEAAAEVCRVASVVATWKLHFSAAGVDRADITFIAGHVDSRGLRQVRADLVNRYSTAFRHIHPCAH